MVDAALGSNALLEQEHTMCERMSELTLQCSVGTSIEQAWEGLRRIRRSRFGDARSTGRHQHRATGVRHHGAAVRATDRDARGNTFRQPKDKAMLPLAPAAAIEQAFTHGQARGTTPAQRTI